MGETADMTGRICVVTGATSGIGKETAKALAEREATVVLVGRDETKTATTAREIREQTRDRHVDTLLGDLSSQAEIRALAAEIHHRYDRLDVLVNCAGVYRWRRETTVDGLEMTFAVNHLAYFQLTNLLLDLLLASPAARIVNVASGAEAMGRIDFHNLQSERRYSGRAAYGQSKLANLLFTYELARRLTGTGVTVNAVHPGFVNSNFGKDGQPRWMRAMMVPVRPFQRTPARGAETVVYVASSPEVEGVSGAYFMDLRPRRSSERSYDTAVADRLWRISEELTAPAARVDTSARPPSTT